MKTFYAVVILFAASLLGVAIWFSPLIGFGTPKAYANNIPIAELDGLCYPSDVLCRVDFSGDASDMRSALNSMLAVTVKEVEIDGLTIVYGLSPRVCAEVQKLGTG